MAFSGFGLVVMPSMIDFRADKRLATRINNRVVPFVNLLIYENIIGFGRQD